MVLVLSSILAWALFLWIARKNPIKGIPRGERGGCGDDLPLMKELNAETPQLNIPPAAQFKQADQLLQEAVDWAQKTFPEAFGAREGAIKDLAKGTDYYSSFQPTSMENALADQYFKNVMPDVERSIKQNLSLSGLSSSPILASQIATQRGNLGVSIGQYLSNLANTRATNSLTARLGMDPADIYGPHLNTNIGQSNIQTQTDYEDAMARAIQEYNQAMELTRDEKIASKMMSIFDPGGSYMGTWKNPNKPDAYGAQEMQGLGKAMELYSAYKGGSFKDTSQQGSGQQTSMPMDTNSGSASPSYSYADGKQGGSLSDYFDKNYNQGYSWQN